MTDTVDQDGRVRIPADLDSVTAIGEEDHSGIDPAAVERIWQAARHWYEAGMHPAIQVCLRHRIVHHNVAVLGEEYMVGFG